MDTKHIIGTWSFVRCLREDGSVFPVNMTFGYKFDADGSGYSWHQRDSDTLSIPLAWEWVGERLHLEIFGEGKGHYKSILDMPSPDQLVHTEPKTAWHPMTTRDFFERIAKMPNTALEATPHSHCGFASEFSGCLARWVRGASAFDR